MSVEEMKVNVNVLEKGSDGDVRKVLQSNNEGNGRRMEEQVMITGSRKAGSGTLTTTAAVPKFSVKEAILAFHGPLPYDGVILGCQFDATEDEYAYFIHYKGWNKNCDEWVLERLILKRTEETLGLQQSLKIETEVLDLEKPGKKKPKSKSKKKRKKENEAITTVELSTPIFSAKPKPWSIQTESERRFQTKQEIKIDIPERLKLVLFDDWHLVARKKKVVILPARKSIMQIFQMFLEGKDENKDRNDFVLCDGLRTWFKFLCRSSLLYNQAERDQFAKIHEEIQKHKIENPDGSTEMKMGLSDYYGAVHLLRMFTELGAYLTRTDMSLENVANFQRICDQFFQFLIEKFDEVVFQEDYQVAAQQEDRGVTIN
ncbi:unnamed protein product [Orchesella dallaii]|uniref:MRG domain-containing protein n=1 Tax=Orchesella dallaii TaxID=48710 RepID=A0ABP1RPA1_9HEXA